MVGGLRYVTFPCQSVGSVPYQWRHLPQSQDMAARKADLSTQYQLLSLSCSGTYGDAKFTQEIDRISRMVTIVWLGLLYVVSPKNLVLKSCGR